MRSLVAVGLLSAATACGLVEATAEDRGGTPRPAVRDDDAGALVGAVDPRTPDGGPAPAPLGPLVRSGSRLRAVYLQTADGARERAGWHDVERDEDCTFGTGFGHADYRERCLPSRYPLIRTGDAHFTDASCQREIFARREAACGDEIQRYVVLPDGVHVVGARVHPATPYRFDLEGRCVPETDPAVEYYESGARVPPSAFVEGTIAVEPPAPGARFSYVSRTTSDGAREPLQVVDVGLGTTCAPRRAADGLLRCAPEPVGIVAEHRRTGPDCTSAVAECIWSQRCAPPPWSTKAFVLDEEGGAAPRARFFAVEPYPADAHPYFFSRTPGGDCVQGTEPWAGLSVGIAGAELAAEGMAAVADEIEQAPTRLQRRVYAIHPAGADPGVPAIVGRNVERTYPWRDTALGDDCKFERTRDGRVRCVSSNATLTVLYADDACTAARVRASGGRRFLRVEGEGCGVSLRRITNRPSLLQTYYVERDDGTGRVACVPEDAGASTLQVLEVAEDVTTALAEGARVVE